MMVLARCRVAAPGIAFGADKATEQRVQKRQDALAAVYAAAPSAQGRRVAAGYAAFSNFGMKILIAGAVRARALRSTTRPRR
jgi:hypothetical protein